MKRKISMTVTVAIILIAVAVFAVDVTIRHAMDMVLLLSVVFAVIILYFVHNSRGHKKSMAQLDKMMERAVLDERCFRTLAAHCGMVVVEWNYAFTKMREYKVYEELTDIDAYEVKDYNDKIMPEMIHPDDVELHRNLLRDIVAGVIDRLSIRIRVLTRDGSYRWTEHSSVTITDDNGKAYKAIGFFEDIDEEVRKEESLNQLAQTDSLTRLYNKEATRLLIEETLKEATHGELLAMICFDIDNFKSINDTFGHLYGDEVLMDVSRKIKELFRSSDVLGRFGGDEFVLLVKNPPSIDFIREKTRALCDSIRETYTVEDVSLAVSASVGVAVYPKDGTSYEELYKKADEASYKVKRSGKDRFLFFGD